MRMNAVIDSFSSSLMHAYICKRPYRPADAYYKRLLHTAHHTVARAILADLRPPVRNITMWNMNCVRAEHAPALGHFFRCGDLDTNLMTLKHQGVSEQRFNVPLLGHFGDDFYRPDDPTNSVKALKEASWPLR